MLGHPLRVLATPFVAVLVLVLLGTTVPAHAAAAEDPQLVLKAPETARAGRSTTTQVVLSGDPGQPAAGLEVALQRQNSEGTWTTLAESALNEQGVADLAVVPAVGPQRLRATLAQDGRELTSAPVDLEGIVVASTLRLYGSSSVVDESSGHLSVRWTGSDGFPVRGRITVYHRRSGQAWSRLGSTTTGWDGRAVVTVRPRWDTYYQVHGSSGVGWKPATSSTWKVDNRPPLAPVALPSGAPRPYALPAQRRAVGAGTSVKVTLISDATWRRMVGRSWHSGCPVGRSQLRYITTNYWGFDGYRHRGELVVRATAVSKFKSALMKLYGAKVRIRAMYLPDRFGKNPSTPGANDVQSMKHDNTSAFNCRGVTGNPGTRSPHTYGRSIDLNPWENPFHSRVGWLPNSWWAYKQVGTYAWKSRSHPAVKAMVAAGFRWTYGTSDSQHFDG